MINTNIDFPLQIPCVLRQDYGFRHVQPFRRTDMASGRARQRRMFSSVPSELRVTWHFRTAGQVRLFEAWFNEALDDGVEWFNMRLKSPLGMTMQVCRFAEMYVGPRLVSPSRWEIDATLEVYERPLPAPGYLDHPEWLLGSDIFDIAMNKEWPAA